MVPRNHPDGIHVAFDDHRLVGNAGLLLPATLGRRLGLSELAGINRPILFTSNLQTLASRGVLGDSWRLPPPHPDGRRPLVPLASVAK